MFLVSHLSFCIDFLLLANGTPTACNMKQLRFCVREVVSLSLLLLLDDGNLTANGLMQPE